LNAQKRIIIIGATSSIAEHCARLWAKDEPAEFVLVARDNEKMNLIAKDLQARTQNTSVTCIESDFLNSEKIQSTVDSICIDQHLDIVLIAHGSLPNQKDCQASLDACKASLEINALSPVYFAEAFAKHLETAGKGALAIIGSVAGDRGRKSNYVYGAAKGLVGRYAQGLQHRFANTDVKVVLIKPGPTDTPMTAHLKQEGIKLAAVEVVAKQITQGISHGKRVIYAPGKWRLIMLVIQHLPNFLFRKMDI